MFMFLFLPQQQTGPRVLLEGRGCYSTVMNNKFIITGSFVCLRTTVIFLWQQKDQPPFPGYGLWKEALFPSHATW